MKILNLKSTITAPTGFLASGIYCGIRKNKTKKDLALIYSPTPCAVASVYTRNKVKGAPIYVTQKNIENGIAKAIICNSGNANTCNADGIEVATKTCDALAKELSIDMSDIVIASTGVIGQPLNVDAIISGIPSLVSSLSEESGNDASEAILTTDLVRKEIAIEFEISGTIVRIAGIAKGSGMVNPDMATILSFITTDIDIDSSLLSEALSYVTNNSYNMITVDGDTSTNDMVTVLANGQAKNKRISEKNKDYYSFLTALEFVACDLARKIAKDGEGATKLITCVVLGADTIEVAKEVALSIVSSSLVKTAMFGSDANWGRILCAIGYTKCPVDISKIDISFKSNKGEINVCKSGAGIDFSEEIAKDILLQDEVEIIVKMNCGEMTATAWGCDLSYDYVKINGDYRT